MTIRFRTAIMLLLGGMALLTLVTVGIFSYVNARSAAQKLTEQILEKTALGIQAEIEKLLGDADYECALTSDMLKSGQLKFGDFPELVKFWHILFNADTDVTSLYLALDASGEALGMTRLRGDPTEIWETRRLASDGPLRLSEYTLADYPEKAFSSESPGPDLRSAPGISLHETPTKDSGPTPMSFLA